MPWNLSSDRPIYHQLIEHIERQILSGKYSPGDKFPSVRELASEASVNPNTMQRALQELENRGLLTTNRTSGRAVTEDLTYLEDMKHQLASEQFQIFYINMKNLGYSKDTLISFVQEECNKKGE